MEKRNLSGIFLRKKRDNGFENICFEELTKAERDDYFDRLNDDGKRQLVGHLVDTLNEIGDAFNLRTKD